MGIRVVVYDLDGTLIDSLGASKTIYESFLMRHGSNAREDDFNHLNGASLREIIQFTQERYGIVGDPDLLANCYQSMLIEYYREHVRPMPYATTLLSVLKTYGISQYIVTSASAQLLEQVLSKYGWTDLIDGVICGDQVSKGKPDPEIYNMARIYYDLTPEESIVIEDSDNGVSSAKAAGFRVLQVSRKPVTDNETIEGLEDILSYLGKWGGYQ